MNKASIIVPVYYDERFIAKAIRLIRVLADLYVECLAVRERLCDRSIGFEKSCKVEQKLKLNTTGLGRVQNTQTQQKRRILSEFLSSA